MGIDSEREPPDAQPEVVIRPVRAEDAEAVHEIRRQPSVLEFTTALPSERLADGRRFLEGFGPDDHVLVAEIEHRVVGLAGLHVRGGKLRHGGSVGVMVHDAFQGPGVGRALLEALLAIADDHLGLVRVELDVVADNERAIALYERLGFAHEGRKRQAVYRRGGYVDVLIMGRLR
jgi:putative acetyltransferase